VTFEYYLANSTSQPLTITVTEVGGDIIKAFSSDSEDGPSNDAGMHRFYWDMRYPGTVMPPPNGALDGFMSVDYSPPTAPVAPPGQYRVQLMVDGKTYEQSFEIRKNPGIKASNDDLSAQFDLMVDIRDRFTEVSDTVLEIRAVRARLKEHRAGLSEDSMLKADAIMDQLRGIEGILMIWMGTDAHPMMWSAPGLTEKLSSLSNAVNSGDARPTESMYAVFEDLTKRFEFERGRLNQIIDQELAPALSGEPTR
jgi:hypothetical protein